MKIVGEDESESTADIEKPTGDLEIIDDIGLGDPFVEAVPLRGASGYKWGLRVVDPIELLRRAAKALEETRDEVRELRQVLHQVLARSRE